MTKPLPALNLVRAPETADQRKRTMQVCRNIVRAWQKGLTRKQVETFATQMYTQAMETVSKKVRPPALDTSKVLVPKSPSEHRSPGGLIIP